MDVQSPYERQQATSEPEPHRLFKIFFAIVALLIAALLLTGGYYYGSSLNTDGTQSDEKAPTGLLIMATAPLSEDRKADWIFPTTYDFGRKGFGYVPVDRLAASPDTLNLAYQHTFSHNGNFVAYVAAQNVKGALSLSQFPMQVYLADVSAALTYDDFVSAVQNAESITTGESMIRQFPSVSNDGDILYAGRASSDDNQVILTSDAEEWEVHLVSAGEDKTIAKGIQPKWVDTGHFVFLKNDGLYLYDVTNESEKKIWGMRGKATTRMSLDVSDDAQYIAWAAPETGNAVYIFRVLRPDTGMLALSGTISISGMYAIFSPDSRFVAVQSPVPTNEAFNDWEVRVNIYDVQTLAETSYTVSLKGSEPSVTYLTDWRP